MNILFVHETCGWWGGVEQNVADAARLRQRGHACFLAFSRTARDPEAYARGFDDTASLDSGLPPLLRRWRPDVIYVHKIERIAPVLAARRTERLVRMVHDHDLHCPRSHKYHAWSGRICTHAAGWRCWLDGAFLARERDRFPPLRYVDIPARLADMRAHAEVDQLVVASRYMREQLVMNGLPASRIAVVPPALDLPLAASRSIDAPGRGRVLYVGQLVRGKGVDLLLAALARAQHVSGLDIVGTGNARSALERQARRLGLAERTRFHGWVAPSAQAALYAQCDIAVVPSRWPEPFGLVGPQAMMHRRAVVAFDVGGVADWLDHGETGLRVSAGDVTGFAAALDDLLADLPRARRMGRRAEARAREHLSFPAYLDALEHVLAPRHSNPTAPTR